MSTWVSAAPVIGAGSLDGFAIGALMTGACALAVTAPRRTRGRKAPSARDRAVAAEEAGWLCEHVMAAEAGASEVAAEAVVAGGSSALAAAPVPTSGETPPGLTSRETPPGLTSRETPPGLPSRETPPGLPSALIPQQLISAAYVPRLPSLTMRTATMRTALPSETVVPELVAAGMAHGLVAQAVASALAAAPVGSVVTAETADPFLAAAPAGLVQAAEAADLTVAAAAVAPAPGAEAFDTGAERLVPLGESGAQARRGAAKGAGSYRSRHRLGNPVAGGMPQARAEPVFPDPPQSDRAPGGARRTEARRPPRHAAPSLSFGSRLTGFGSRMTGLLAPRALATGARG
jgi:hypothetical protein